MQIPQTTSPLKTGIRTTEGILTAVIAFLISLTSGIDPHSLPRKEAAWLVAATGVLYGLQRALVKVVALQKGLGVGPPIENQQLQSTLAAVADQAMVVENMVNTHGDLLKTLSNLDLTKLPSQQQIDDLLKKLEALIPPGAAGVDSLPPEVATEVTPVPDPAAAAVGSLTPAQEQAVQPTPEADPADPVPGAPPAAPSASATIPPPAAPGG